MENSQGGTVMKKRLIAGIAAAALICTSAAPVYSEELFREYWQENVILQEETAEEGAAEEGTVVWMEDDADLFEEDSEAEEYTQDVVWTDADGVEAEEDKAEANGAEAYEAELEEPGPEEAAELADDAEPEEIVEAATEGFGEEDLLAEDESELSEDLADELAASDVNYTYEIRPLLPPFNHIYYVKTKDPDPTSFRFIDRNSSLPGGSDNTACVCSLLEKLYQDVSYENEKTYRVKDGYLFQNYYCRIDGGTLTLQRKDISGIWRDSSVKVSCQAVTDEIGYLLNTCTDSSMGFFEKLNAIQRELDSLAVYPRSVYDPDKYSDHPYPFLATSPYPELSLNRHYNVYEKSEKGSLTQTLYPFVYDSLAFPGTIGAAASRIDSGCRIDEDDAHWKIRVSYHGETRSYGGAGEGDSDPVFKNKLTEKFLFDGSGKDLAAGTTIDRLRQVHLRYGELADQNIENLKKLISGEIFRKEIGSGCWIRVAAEGSFSYGTAYAYAACGAGSTPVFASDAWVDGRYVGKNEGMIPGATFAEHPQADIILRDLRYTDIDGNEHQNDIIYEYDPGTDTWTAPWYYVNGYSYSLDTQFPEMFTLTREQVRKLAPDSSSRQFPLSGKIYDGTQIPGTAFGNTLLKGISLPKKMTIDAGEDVKIPIVMTPANATHQYVRYTAGNEDILYIRDYDHTLYGKKAGTTSILGTSWDGGYTASCTVTVRQREVKTICDEKLINAFPVCIGDTAADLLESGYSFTDKKTGREVTGKFSFDRPDTIIKEGMQGVSWTFKPFSDIYSTVKGTLWVRAGKEKSQFEAWDKEYGKSLSQGVTGKNKKAQPMTVKARSVRVKYSKLKKKKQTVSAKKVFILKNSRGKVTYKKIKGNRKITVSKKGKIRLKKGLKKGTYKLKVRVTAAGNSTYKAGSKTVVVRIKVK